MSKVIKFSPTTAAESATHSYRMPEGNVAPVLIGRAMTHYWHWFFQQRRSALLPLENSND
jgi:hypothetical protein